MDAHIMVSLSNTFWGKNGKNIIKFSKSISSTNCLTSCDKKILFIIFLYHWRRSTYCVAILKLTFVVSTNNHYLCLKNILSSF